MAGGEGAREREKQGKEKVNPPSPREQSWGSIGQIPYTNSGTKHAAAVASVVSDSV